MRGALALAIVLAATVTASVTAWADSGPVIAVPGRAGVPVMINGRDASWAVVEGDWGLARGVHVQPTVIGGWDVYQGKSVGRYYPSSGKIPGYGRLEIEPPANRALPQPAESFYRSWSAESAAPTELQDIPQNPPPVIVAPEINLPRRPRR